jgi:hypothetical protein
MLKKLKFIITVAALVTTFPVLSQSASGGWSNIYGFSGNAKRSADVIQADLIAKKEAGYYDNVGRQTYNNQLYTTNTYGTYTSSTTTITSETNTNINGDNNTTTGAANKVNVSGKNNGDLNGSVNLTSNSNNEWGGSSN